MNSNKIDQASNVYNMWKDLLLWRTWYKTALLFSLTLMLLEDITVNPLLSVVSVTGMIMLSITVCYACYVWGMRKLKKSDAVKHPFQRYLDMDMAISKETADHVANLIIFKLNPILLRLRSLFLVEDLLDTLKLLLILCVLNILGDYIDGMTLLVLGVVLLFTLPKLYEWKKSTINMKLQQLQELKTRLLMPKNKTIPTATVDPEFVSANSSQESNYFDNELDNTVLQYHLYEQDNGQDFTSDYNWQEQDPQYETYEHIKET